MRPSGPWIAVQRKSTDDGVNGLAPSGSSSRSRSV